MINMLLYKGQRVSANGAMAGELGTIYEGYKVAQAANALVDVAVTYLALEAGVRFYNTNEAKYWIEQLQGAVKYIVCQDIEGIEYYIDKAGNMYDNSLKLIPATARPEGVIVTGVKIDKDYIRNNIVSINKKVKSEASKDSIIKKKKVFNVVEGQVYRCLYEFNADYIGYPDRTDGKYTKELGKVTVNCGEKYNVYINRNHTGICDKDNCTNSFVLDTTEETGTKEITISQYLYYNPYVSVYDGQEMLCNSISFVSGDTVLGDFTTKYDATDPIIAAFDFSIYESNGGSVSGNLSGDGIEDGSIDININETGCMDIDAYNNSPVANRDSISLNPDLVNDVVENNKSIDDVLSSLDYSKGNIVDQIIDKTAIGESEENKSVDEERNNTGRITIDEKKAPHIFRNKSGHFSEDTPENRKILEDMANDISNHLGKKYAESIGESNNEKAQKDSRGNEWYGKITEDGKQIWAEVRGNYIRDAGINDIPIDYNQITGLKDIPNMRNPDAFRNIKIRGDEVMKLEGNHVFNAIIDFLNHYNEEISYDDDVTKVIEEIKNKKSNFNKEYTEFEGYKVMFDMLDDFYLRTGSDEIGGFLGELYMYEEGKTADAASWEEWLDAIERTNNKDSTSSNSGDTTSISATTGIIGAIGSVISRRKKKER